MANQMNRREAKLYGAVAKALDVELDVSAHAVIRYVERFLRHDVNLSFMMKNQRYNSSGTRITDNTIITYIKRNHPEQYELALDHIKYSTRGHVTDFTDDEGIRYTIRDFNVVTLFQERIN